MTNAIINILSFMHAFGCMLLGIMILVKRKRDRISILFVLMMFSGVVYYSIYPYTWFRDFERFRILYSIKVALLGVVYGFMLHFHVELTGIIRRGSLKALLYIPGAAAASLMILIADRFPRFVWTGARWSHIYPDILIWDIVFPLYYLSIPLACVIIIFLWHRKSGLKKDVLVGRIMIVSLTVPAALTFAVDFLLRAMGSALPSVGPFFYFIYIICMTYCLIRYRFLTFNISSVTGEILSNINECIAAVDPNGYIIYTNTRLDRTINAGCGSHFKGIFINDGKIEAKMASVMRGDISGFQENVRVNANHGIMNASAYVSRIIDSIGDFTGLLVIIKEQPGISEFVKMYNITDRQFQIIDMVINGATNLEISGRLGLGRRTVETHINNIYIKLQVKNRVELMKIASKFNLL